MNKNLPTKFNKTEQISTVYTLTKTIRYKISNHEEFIYEGLRIYEELIYDIIYEGHFRQYEELALNCTTSPFTDPNHGHIVTGDIRIV